MPSQTVSRNGVDVKVEVDGLSDVLKVINDVEQGIRNRVLRKAFRAYGKQIIKPAKAAAPRRSGTLKKSIGQKVATYKSGAVVLVVGPRRGVVGEYEGKKVVPSRTAHLVEFGTKRSRATPFMQRAAVAARSEGVRQFTTKVREELPKEVKKAVARRLKRLQK